MQTLKQLLLPLNTTGRGTAFTPPYTLNITPAANVKSQVMAGAGATLSVDCLGVLDLPTKNRSQTPEEIQSTRIYPNPAKYRATIAVTLKKNEQAVISIYDVHGRLVDNLGTITAERAGTRSIQYNLNGKPGIYNVVVNTNKGMRSTYKLIVQ